MKNLFVSEGHEIIIDKELFSSLSYTLFLYTKLAVEHARSRNEALPLIDYYAAVEEQIKTACCKNNVSYKHYVSGREKTFRNLVEKKFLLVDEPPESEIITDGQVPF
ncbi:MAG: hypothetical protein K2O42_05010 [Oscillospiraceae bacterium]|nr:hypothetical protein [Oscillospiraceae bacterium]